MKILFVVHDGVSHEPLGIEYLSSSLKAAGHRTKACMQSQTMDFIRLWRPHFVAFQVLSGDEKRWGTLAREIKDAFPSVKTIFGGPHYLFFAKAGQGEADIIIRGDGEKAIIDAVEGRAHTDLSAIPNLDDLPRPDRSILYNDTFPGIKNNVIRNFISCRGCPYKCTYCYNSNREWQAMVESGKKRLRYHSPEYMVDDIERTFKDFGGQLVSFQDDIFGIDMAWLERFAKLYGKVRYPFFAQLRPRLITEDRIKLLKEAGIHIVSFAIESGNEKNRQEVLDRDEPNDLIRKGCELLHRHGIKFRMQNLLGLPVEDPLGDALETLRFNAECRPTLSWCSLLQAYPGTVIAEYVVKRGIVKSMDELAFMVNATFFDEGSLPIKDKAKIERLHKYWSAVVRWPWLYGIVTKVLININFGKKFHNWVFEKSKQYINAKEYWRVEKFDRHLSMLRNPLDRLGGELVRNPEKEQVCA
jgi:anaerobic magnesium-protoporphyrin IX monomethyl ester cyclase